MGRVSSQISQKREQVRSDLFESDKLSQLAIKVGKKPDTNSTKEVVVTDEVWGAGLPESFDGASHPIAHVSDHSQRRAEESYSLFDEG